MTRDIIVPELDELIAEGRVAGTVGQWTEHDVAIMRAYYGKSHTADLAKHLGRSVESVYKKAQRLGLGKKR